MLNENGKLLLGFAEDNNLALLNTFFCTPKIGVSYTFQSVNRSEEQARLDYILTNQADRRLICCINVRRPPLEAPEWDYNPAYTRVRIPRRSAPTRRKRVIIHPRSEEQARLDYILTNQADRRLICCINVRRPPLEAPEWDYNPAYTRVRIPRRSAPTRRKRVIIHPRQRECEESRER